MKTFIFKNLILFSILILSNEALAQVGIGTDNPDPSASLDVFSTNKGVKFPTYTLIDVTDDQSPIMNPAEGLIIYNDGGTYTKGYYAWINQRWNNLITSETVNKAIYTTVASLQPDGTRDEVNATPTDNILNNMFLVSKNSENVILVDDDTFTLPAGKYKITISGDVVRPSQLGPNTPDASIPIVGGTALFYYRSYTTYIKDTSGNLLAPPQISSRMWAKSFSSYSFTHYIELTQTTSFNVYWDTTTDSNPDIISPRTGINVSCYELK